MHLLLYFLRFITSIYEIENVWANDAHKTAVFVSLVYSPFLLYLILYSKQKKVLEKDKIIYREINIYNFIRNPEYTFLLMIALGCSLITVSLSGITLSFIILLPFMLIRIKIVEKDILKNDPDYSNYIMDVPKLFPNVFFLIKRLLFKKI